MTEEDINPRAWPFKTERRARVMEALMLIGTIGVALIFAYATMQ